MWVINVLLQLRRVTIAPGLPYAATNEVRKSKRNCEHKLSQNINSDSKSLYAYVRCKQNNGRNGRFFCSNVRNKGGTYGGQ